MKKLLGLILSLAMIFAISSTAFAAESVPLVPDPVDTTSGDFELMPMSSLSLSFGNLSPNSKKKSSETYYIEGSNAKLKINSATWMPASQTIRVGWYNVETGVGYYIEYSGGSIKNKKINSNGVPDGDYKVYVQNVGSSTITSGTLQYEVD